MNYLEAESSYTFEGAHREVVDLDASLPGSLEGFDRNDALFDAAKARYSDVPVIIKSVMSSMRRVIPTPEYQGQDHRMGSGY